MAEGGGGGGGGGGGNCHKDEILNPFFKADCSGNSFIAIFGIYGCTRSYVGGIDDEAEGGGGGGIRLVTDTAHRRNVIAS